MKETKPLGWSVTYTNDVTPAKVEADGRLRKAEDSQTADEAAVAGGGTITLKNSKWTVSLPSTGGAGTTPFYATGVSLLLLAAIWFVWEQRKRAKMD